MCYYINIKGPRNSGGTSRHGAPGRRMPLDIYIFISCLQNGDWAVEAAQTEENEKQTKSQTEKHTSNKENLHKNKKSKKRKLSDASVDKNSKKISNNVKRDKIQSDKSLQTDNSLNKKQRSVEKVNVQENGVEKFSKNLNSKMAKKVAHAQSEKTHKLSEKLKKSHDSINKNVSPKIRNKSKVLNGKVEKRHDRLELSKTFDSPKKVKFVLKNNSMQGTIDYYKSVRQSPSIPFDSSKKPTKTNLKVSTPSPINPFFKKKLRLK